MSGYMPCACRDCFETAIGDEPPALCHECEEASCDINGEHECSAPGAYGGTDMGDEP